MATRGPKKRTLQTKVRQPELYTSLQMEQNPIPENTEDHEDQPESVTRPKQSEKTEEPKEQNSHEEILSVHIDDTQKSTYTTKVGSTEATALFDSSASLSCISKQFYNQISRMELSKVIDTNARPAIVVTTASNDELINLGQCG